jgi:hypothetical protein
MLLLWIVVVQVITCTHQNLSPNEALAKASLLLQELSPLAHELTLKTTFALNNCPINTLPETTVKSSGNINQHIQELIGQCGATVVKSLIPIQSIKELRNIAINQKTPLQPCHHMKSVLVDQFSSIQACVDVKKIGFKHQNKITKLVQDFVSISFIPMKNIISETTIVAGPGKEKTLWKRSDHSELFNRYDLYARSILPGSFPIPGLVAFIALETIQMFQICVGSAPLQDVTVDICNAIKEEKIRNECKTLSWIINNNNNTLSKTDGQFFTKTCPTDRIIQPTLEAGDVLLIDSRTIWRRISEDKATFTRVYVRMDFNRKWPGWYVNNTNNGENKVCVGINDNNECKITTTTTTTDHDHPSSSWWWFINKNITSVRDISLYRGSERIGRLGVGESVKVEPSISTFTLRVDDVARKAWIFTEIDVQDSIFGDRYFFVDYSSLDTPIVHSFNDEQQRKKQGNEVLWREE